MNKKEEKAIGSEITTTNIIDRAIMSIAEGVTGIAASDRREWYKSLGHLLQRIRSGRFLSTLREEWQSYTDKGRVEDDYLISDQHAECLQELLDFLDQDSPDEIRFTVLKKIFLTAATEAISDRNSALPQQYMKICRSLSSGETLVLLGAYDEARSSPPADRPGSAATWIGEVAESSGLKHGELVELHERHLIEKNLLTPRLHSDRSGIALGPHSRLTNLGWEICMFIQTYDDQQDA